MNVTFQPHPRTRRATLPARCLYVRGLFDQGLKVAEIIEELKRFDCNRAELQWIADSQKGKVLSWAKKELKTLK